MATTTIVIVLAALLLPLIIILWLTESPLQRQTRQARYMRRQGLSQQAIATMLGISRTTVRRRLAIA